MKHVPNLATFRLPLAIGGLGAAAPLLMGAAPQTAMAAAAAAPGFVLTGNPLIDGMVIAAITGPLAGLAAWLIKTFAGVSITFVAAVAEAYADAIEARARRTPSKTDDETSAAFAKAIRAGAARLRNAEPKDKAGEE